MIEQEGVLSLSLVEIYAHTAAEYFGFTYDVYKAETAGSEILEPRLPNGTWTGCIQEVLSKKAESALLSFWSEGASDFIKFCYPTLFIETAFVTAKPKLALSWFSALWPFTPLVWILIIISTIVSGIMTYILLLLERHLQSKIQKRTLCNFLSASSLILINQLSPTFTISSNAHATRMLFAFFSLFVLVISGAYQEMLLSFLTIPVEEDVPRDFQQLSDSGYRRVMVYSHLVLVRALSKNDRRPLVHALLKEVDSVKDIHTCIWESINMKNTACMSVTASLNNAVNEFVDANGIPQLLYIRDDILGIFIGGMTQRDESISLVFDQYLINTMDYGLLNKWKENEIFNTFMKTVGSVRRNMDNQKKQKDNLGRSLSLNHFCGPFAHLLIGILSSTIIVFLECLFSITNLHFPKKTIL